VTRANAELTLVILAGGRGTRMGTDKPKVLLPAGGIPMLERVARTCAHFESSRTIAILGYSAEEVRPILVNRDVEIETQVPLLGPVHALTALEPRLRDWGGTLIVFPADVPLVTATTLQRLCDAHVSGQAGMTFVTAQAARAYGLMRILRDEHDDVVGIVGERDASRQQRAIRECTSGVFAVQPALLAEALAGFHWDQTQRERPLAELAAAVRRLGHRLAAIEAATPDEVRGINSQTELAEASAIMRQSKCEELMSAGVTIIDPATTYVGPDVEVGHDTVLHPNVYLEGRTRVGNACEVHAGARLVDAVVEDHAVILNYCVVTDARIGPRAQVGPFAHIRPGSDIGEDARVGNFVELKKTALGAGSKASHLSYLGDATIGNRVNIGAGTITCNFDGERKHQTVIGDEAFIGSDSQLIAPVRVGEKAFVAAGSSITADVPDGALGIARGRQINKDGWGTARRQRSSH
jgi:bifunctional UDP-N-acetylglucosamine pyrophosphorylase / glucosamine-1-phosphate N-acetyltransferase